MWKKYENKFGEHIIMLLHEGIQKKAKGILGGWKWQFFNIPINSYWASLVAQLAKNPPAMWETWVRSLGCEDPLEKGKATHSSILTWRIPWTV